ncbi:UNVERIFIED_CONTAM: flagellar biogenesis protein FliO [Jeotgalibacillus campisalis]
MFILKGQGDDARLRAAHSKNGAALRFRAAVLVGQLGFLLVGVSAAGYYLKRFSCIELYLKWLGLTEPL